MRFLVDAYLPTALCAALRARGFDTLHTRELPAGNETPDTEINRLSIEQSWIVISKDTDFYYSHILHGKPFKLLLIRTGNLDRKSLVTLFERNLDQIIHLLAESTLVELDYSTVKAIL